MMLAVEYCYDKCKNIYGISKMILLKLSVGLIVLEGLIVTFMIAAGDEPNPSDDMYNREETLQRAFCFLVLIEFSVLSIFAAIAFGRQIQPPSPEVIRSIAVTSDMPTTFGAFVCDVFAFRDVFGRLTLNEEIAKPLNNA
jgi:hypothetical protein